jgi:DNA-binding MarR family transcriptional regulator
MNHDIPLPWHPLVWDVNNDGSFTVTDLGLWLQHVFFLPGDWIIWMILRYAPEVGRFLEVDTREYGTSFSALLSVFSWLAVIVTIMTTSHYLASIDRAVTGLLRGILSRGLMHAHALRRALGNAFRRRLDWLRRGVKKGDLPTLTTEELRVLKAHAYVNPNSALALSDLVRATGVPRAQIVDILDRLRELHLIDRRTGASSGEPGYRLTDPGRDLLSAHHF